MFVKSCFHWQSLHNNASDIGNLGWHDTDRKMSICVASPKVAKASKEGADIADVLTY